MSSITRKARILLLVVGLVVAALPIAARADTTWPVLHGDPGNTDFVPLAGARVLVPRWQALQVKPDSSVVVIGPEGHLYTVTMDTGPCHLHAFDADGNALWCSSDVRWGFTFPVVAPDGTVFVTDGTEVFRFAADGTILWRVPATGRALGPLFSRDGYLLIFDQLGVATAYDPANGAQVAQLAIPSATNPRPSPLPAQVTLFKTGAPFAGWDPTPALLDAWVDAFFNYNTAVGNNIPAMDANGRMFIGVAKGPAPSTQGVFYGIDFVPPAVPGGQGSLSIACSTPMGLNSSTSPALSADGQRIYAGDASTPTAQLRAFNTSDCSQAWSLGLEAQSLASPTVDLDGRIFMTVNQKVFAFQDNVTSATQLWQRNFNGDAVAAGFASARANSVIARSANYLYVATSFFSTISGLAVPMAHRLATLDPATGSVLNLAVLGEESDSTLSIGPDAQVYVPTKPIVKAIALGNATVRPSVPAAQSGIFALAPASYKEVTADGVTVALDYLGRSENAGQPTVAARFAALTSRQVAAAGDNLSRAHVRVEISDEVAFDVDALLDVAALGLGGGPIDYAAVGQALTQARDRLRCGDAIVDATEECDDGNFVNGDACTNRCEAARCGDGIVGPGEACDDGNANDNDACTNACQNAGCGDGIVGPGEECDDGNAVDGDACTNICRLARCGDAIVGPGEECDDGNVNENDACTNACTDARCGDGVVGPGEACDDGNAVDGDACTNACANARCGDAIVGPGETCDDGGTLDGDGCSGSCQQQDICRNLQDDDDDGSVDCDDSDCACAAFAACTHCSTSSIVLSDRLDSLKLKLGFDVDGALDPAGSPLTVLVTNAAGIVYAAALEPGDVVQRGRYAWAFRDPAAERGQGTHGGLARIRITFSPGRAGGEWRIELKAWGDLSAATLADMSVQIVIGERSFRKATQWSRTSRGWRAGL